MVPLTPKDVTRLLVTLEATLILCTLGLLCGLVIEALGFNGYSIVAITALSGTGVACLTLLRRFDYGRHDSTAKRNDKGRRRNR